MPVKFDSILWIIHLNKVIVYRACVDVWIEPLCELDRQKISGELLKKTGNYAYNEEGYGD